MSAIVLAAAVALPTCAALAQQGGPRPVTPPGSKTAKEAPAPGSDAGLLKRVEQLEEQLVDMQVLVGTLESLAKGAPVPAPGAKTSPAMSVGDAGRLDAIETQVRAMAAQLEALQEQLRSLAERPGFGAVTVAPVGPKDTGAEEPKDDLDRVFPWSAPGSGSKTAKSAKSSKAPDAEDDTPPQQLYERAYGYLLQKDFTTAEATFDSFLKRHPAHQLAGNAQYWLGQKDAACTSFAEFATKYPTPPAHIKTLVQSERQRSGC